MTVAAAGLRRVLGARDLVYFNVSAILGFRWLSTAAQLGPASLTYWLLGALLFFVPFGLVVAELSARLPGEGGPYLWARSAFGDLHGFIAGWCYLVSNLVYLPSLLLFSATQFFLIGGESWRGLGENPWLAGAFCVVLLWSATLLNIRGLDRAKWLPSVGAYGTWLIFGMLIAGGLLAVFRSGSHVAFDAAAMVPNLASTTDLANLATIAFAYAGLEAATLMGDEIREPQRTVPRAILISALVITALYMAGTATLLVATPPGQVDAVTGVAQALGAIGQSAHLPEAGRFIGLLLTISYIGGLGAWVTAVARLPFSMGLNDQMPPALGRVHRRWGTPHVALFVQAVISSLFLLMSFAGATVRHAITVLTDMTLILNFIPFLYMFAALPVLRAREGRGRGDGFRMPGGLLATSLVAFSAFGVTLGAIVVALIPPSDGVSPQLFLWKVVGGSVLMVGVGLFFYLRSAARQASSANSARPLPGK